jgi:endogenous inhibitor of DNA gyrase (YacG/DUF329 family)
MRQSEHNVRYGRNCPICGKPVELRLITCGAPFRCQDCDAMLDISSFYAWLTHALATTVAFVVLWKVFILIFGLLRSDRFFSTFH